MPTPVKEGKTNGRKREVEKGWMGNEAGLLTTHSQNLNPTHALHTEAKK